MKRKNIIVLAVACSLLSPSAVMAGTWDSSLIENVEENNALYCASDDEEHIADQYMELDIDQDGSNELLIFAQDENENNYHWKLFKDNGNEKPVELIAEDDGWDVGNAGHSFGLIDGKCIHDHDMRSLAGYDYSVDTYVFWQDGELYNLVHEQMITRNFDENGNAQGETEKNAYTSNGVEISEQEGENLLSMVPVGNETFLGDDDEDVSYSETEETVAESDYIFPDSDSRYLEETDLEGMSAQKLCYAKNEIYARLGRDFTSQELKDYFGSKSWYQVQYSSEDFPYDIVNQYAKYNAKFLKEKEEELCPGGYVLD